MDKLQNRRKYYKYGPTLESFIQQMAPTHSKPIPEPRAPGIRKHVLAASLAYTNNVAVAAVKRRKLEAMQRQQRQPSVQDDDDDSLSSNTNLQPQDASWILEAANGSDDFQLDHHGDIDASGGDFDDEELPGLEESMTLAVMTVMRKTKRVRKGRS